MDKRINEFPPLGAKPALVDLVPIWDDSTGTTVYVTYQQLLTTVGDFADMPSSLSGQGGKVLTVNGGGTAYELLTPSSGGGGPRDNEWWVNASTGDATGTGGIFDTLDNFLVNGQAGAAAGDIVRIFTEGDSSVVTTRVVTKNLSFIGNGRTGLTADIQIGNGVVAVISDISFIACDIDCAGGAAGLLTINDCDGDSGTTISSSTGAVYLEVGLYLGSTITASGAPIFILGGLHLDVNYVNTGGIFITGVNGSSAGGGGCSFTGSGAIQTKGGSYNSFTVAAASTFQFISNGTDFQNGTWNDGPVGNHTFRNCTFLTHTFSATFVGSVNFEGVCRTGAITDNSAGGLLIPVYSGNPDTDVLAVGLDESLIASAGLSNMHIRGGISLPLTTITGTVGITSASFHYVCNNGAYAMSLPDLSTIPDGRLYIFTNGDGVGIITINRSGADTINGAVNHLLNAQYDTVTLHGDKANNVWRIIAQG